MQMQHYNVYLDIIRKQLFNYDKLDVLNLFVYQHEMNNNEITARMQIK